MKKQSEIQRLRALVDALVLNASGWTGEAGGPSHNAIREAMEQVRNRRNEIWKERGICCNCGGDHKKEC